MLFDILGDLQPTKIYVDNNGAIEWSKKSIISERTKHIKVKYHFIKQCITDQQIYLEHVNSEHNIADAFTKPLAKTKFEFFRAQFQLRRREQEGGELNITL